jgi:hypothetical protein
VFAARWRFARAKSCVLCIHECREESCCGSVDATANFVNWQEGFFGAAICCSLLREGETACVYSVALSPLSTMLFAGSFLCSEQIFNCNLEASIISDQKGFVECD